jgi:ketosteroid isomerase-like protein
MFVVAPALQAQAPVADSARVKLDTIAILATAHYDIDRANRDWVPGLRQRNAALITAAYADSGLFIAGDGTVTRGRAAITRLYAARFPQLRPIRDGGVVQDGMRLLGRTRIVEWGYAWLEFEPQRAGQPPVRRGGQYLTIWERGADGHWRIARNLAF